MQKAHRLRLYLSCGLVETCPVGQCCSREIMRYMGGTDPIRTLGTQAEVSQATNIYTPRGAHTE